MSTVKIISFAGRLSYGKFSLIKALKDNTTNANFVRHIHKVMKNWQEEKDNFLSMSLDKKRDYYKCREYVKPEQIPTWKEYATQNRDKLAQKIPVSLGCDIKSSMNSTLAEKISVFRGDITTLEVDCIVNAANSSLLGGGGVDGAIHSAAGPLLKEECRTLGGCDVGEAKITGGYKLPAKYVIHTVGPRGEKPDFLKRCYKNSLHIMSQEKLRTIAFPCVSTGIYGYPIEPASHVAVYEVRKHLESNSDNVDRIIFCLFSAEDEVVYQGVLQSYFPLD